MVCAVLNSQHFSARILLGIHEFGERNAFFPFLLQVINRLIKNWHNHFHIFKPPFCIFEDVRIIGSKFHFLYVPLFYQRFLNMV